MLRSLFHRTMKTPDSTCVNATAWDRPAAGATIPSALSRWEHGSNPVGTVPKKGLVQRVISLIPPAGFRWPYIRLSIYSGAVRRISVSSQDRSTLCRARCARGGGVLATPPRADQVLRKILGLAFGP